MSTVVPGVIILCCNVNSNHLRAFSLLRNCLTCFPQALDVASDSLLGSFYTLFDSLALCNTSWQCRNCNSISSFFQIRLQNDCVFFHACTPFTEALETHRHLVPLALRSLAMSLGSCRHL